MRFCFIILLLNIGTTFAQIKYPEINLSHLDFCTSEFKVKQKTIFRLNRNVHFNLDSVDLLLNTESDTICTIANRMRYDTIGNLIEEALSFHNNEPLRIYTSTYENGRNIRMKHIEYGRISDVTEYIYKKDYIRTISNGVSLEYRYDNKQTLVERAHLDDKMNLSNKVSYRYVNNPLNSKPDKESEAVFCIYWNKKDSTLHEDLYRIDSGKFSLSFKETFTYKNKRIIKGARWFKTREGGASSYSEKYIYDKKGQLTAIVYFDENDKPYSLEKNEYLYYKTD